MEYLPVVLTIILVILTIIMAVVGVQLVLVLRELKKTLSKVNGTLDTVDVAVMRITQPLQSIGGMATGLSSGLKIFETFVGWLQKNKDA